MQNLSARQRTLGGALEYSGIGVHSAQPVTLKIEPAPADSGYKIQRRFEDGSVVGPVAVHFARVMRTTLCTTIDLGESVAVATVEHVISALSGLGVDNALITVDGPECPIIDGSAAPFVEGILKVGLEIQGKSRRYIKVMRQVLVRNNDASAALEPYNGRVLDLEIDFDSKVIGRQRMIFDWTPRKYVSDVSKARTFGFVRDAKILRQAGYALGSSLDNSVTIGNDERILNPGGLRYEDEFVRHKLLDAVGDLALAGAPLHGRFIAHRSGHALNNRLLRALFADVSAWRSSTVVPLAAAAA